MAAVKPKVSKNLKIPKDPKSKKIRICPQKKLILVFVGADLPKKHWSGRVSQHDVPESGCVPLVLHRDVFTIKDLAHYRGRRLQKRLLKAKSH